jgi:hypothetical protein
MKKRVWGLLTLSTVGVVTAAVHFTTLPPAPPVVPPVPDTIPILMCLRLVPMICLQDTSLYLPKPIAPPIVVCRYKI